MLSDCTKSAWGLPTQQNRLLCIVSEWTQSAAIANQIWSLLGPAGVWPWTWHACVLGLDKHSREPERRNFVKKKAELTSEIREPPTAVTVLFSSRSGWRRSDRLGCIHISVSAASVQQSVSVLKRWWKEFQMKCTTEPMKSSSEKQSRWILFWKIRVGESKHFTFNFKMFLSIHFGSIWLQSRLHQHVQLCFAVDSRKQMQIICWLSFLIKLFLIGVLFEIATLYWTNLFSVLLETREIDLTFPTLNCECELSEFKYFWTKRFGRLR